VEDDMSLYWQPTLYYQRADGTFQPLTPDKGYDIYWIREIAEGETLWDMPPGLRMIIGDPKQNTPPDDSTPEGKAAGFSCFCQSKSPGADPLCNDKDVPDVGHSFEDAKKNHCDIIRLEVSLLGSIGSRMRSGTILIKRLDR
jgi:hypothetical protein